MTLKLIKMGMDFTQVETNSDILNYRVRTTGENVQGKDGKIYFLEFTRGYRYNVRTTNKRTGAPLKHNIIERVTDNALVIDTQFTTEKGSYCNIALERQLWGKGFLYTQSDILGAVNEISCNHYDRIVFVNR